MPHDLPVLLACLAGVGLAATLLAAAGRDPVTRRARRAAKKRARRAA